MDGIQDPNVANGLRSGFMNKAKSLYDGAKALLPGGTPAAAPGSTPFPTIDGTAGAAPTASAQAAPPGVKPGYFRDAAGVINEGVAPAAAESAPVGLRARASYYGGKALKGAGALGVLAGGAAQAYQANEQSAALDNDTDRVALAGEHAGRFAGSVAGASTLGSAGAAAGAALGSAVPVVGTAAGGFVGGLAGGIVGGGLGYFAPDILKKGTDYLGITDPTTQLVSDKANDIIAARPKTLAAGAPGAAAAAPAAPAAPKNLLPGQLQPGDTSYDDDKTFNANLARQGAGGAFQATAPNGVRVIGNQGGTNEFDTGLRASGPVDPLAAQRAEAARYQRDGIEQSRQAGYAQAATGREDRARSDAAVARSLQGPDTSVIDAQISQAMASGRGNDAKLLMDQKAHTESVAAQRSQAALQADTSLTGIRATEQTQANANQTAIAHNAATNQLAQIQAQRVQSNADREFGLNNAKFGQEQLQNNFKERETAAKSVEDRLGTIFTKQEGDKTVPDVARVGAAAKAINDEIGSRISAARAIKPNNPHYAEAQHLANTLEQKGHAALAPDDLQQLVSQAAIKDRMTETHSIFPGGSSAVDSGLSQYELDPTKKPEGHLFGSDTLTLRNGGTIRANNLRYAKPANALFPDIGALPSTQYDAGLRAK
jgi:hypothetical protein